MCPPAHMWYRYYTVPQTANISWMLSLRKLCVARYFTADDFLVFPHSTTMPSVLSPHNLGHGTPLMKPLSLFHGRQIWVQIGSDSSQIEQIRDFFSASQTVLNSDMKKSPICPFYGQPDQLWVQIWRPRFVIIYELNVQQDSYNYLYLYWVSPSIYCSLILLLSFSRFCVKLW